jgi:hypothetical protein
LTFKQLPSNSNTCTTSASLCVPRIVLLSMTHIFFSSLYILQCVCQPLCERAVKTEVENIYSQKGPHSFSYQDPSVDVWVALICSYLSLSFVAALISIYATLPSSLLEVGMRDSPDQKTLMSCFMCYNSSLQSTVRSRYLLLRLAAKLW